MYTEHRKSFASEHSVMHITLCEILLYNHGAAEDWLFYGITLLQLANSTKC
jgi:hypothetical protein